MLQLVEGNFFPGLAGARKFRGRKRLSDSEEIKVPFFPQPWSKTQSQRSGFDSHWEVQSNDKNVLIEMWDQHPLSIYSTSPVLENVDKELGPPRRTSGSFSQMGRAKAENWGNCLFRIACTIYSYCTARPVLLCEGWAEDFQ